ncbi:3'-5' exoribonuclease YhaM family protein, partial [Thermodesulfobacteriota bacterium]
MTKAKNAVSPKNKSHFFVKDIREKDHVRGQYLVKIKRLAETKKGDPYLSITLADRTGDVEARVWEKAEDFSSLFREGDILSIEGHASSYRNQIQLILKNLSVYEDDADPSLFLETSQKDIPGMMGRLLEIIQEIQNQHIKALLESFFADHQFVSRFKRAPAAKNFHHNYLGGLLEHTLSVCQLMTFVAEHYHELDRDLLLAGAILHDVGKVQELTYDTHIEYTDEGRLLGHLTLGVAMLEEKMTVVKHFPQELALRLKHLILSHHGQY